MKKTRRTRFASLSPSLRRTVLAEVFELRFACPRCRKLVRLFVRLGPPCHRDEIFGLSGEIEQWEITLEPSFALVRHSDGSRCRWRAQLEDGVLKVA